MRRVFVDFETRSKTDIRSGVYKYAACPSTDILCLSIIDETSGDEWLWYPHDGGIPANAALTIGEADLVCAHNAEFDMAIWEFIAVPDYFFLTIPVEKWYCTSAQCRVNALPAALEKAAKALKIKARKDTRGKALIKLLSIPNKDGEFNEDPTALREMGEYCLQDSRLMMQVTQMTRMMSAQEHVDWQINCRINERGAKVDTDFAALAVQYADDEREQIGKRLAELTDGHITKHTQSVRARDWVIAECDDPALVKLMTVHKDGEEKLSFDKNIRAAIIETDADLSNGLNIPDHVFEVIELFDQGNKSSVSKFQRMLDMAEDDGRVRGAFVFAGASQTQRFASRGLQLHNMKRDCWKPHEMEDLKADMAADFEIDDVMNTLAKALRPSIIPEAGKVFVVGDWSAIEGRFLPWLTADPEAEQVLDIFRKHDAGLSKLDIYEHTAQGMRIDDRQIGKVATLALGYQGAVNAFNAMAKAYGLKLPEHEIAIIVKKWRAANPWAVRYWADCERAAVKAMRRAGEYIQIGRCQFVLVEGLIGQTLCGILPDGTIIQYPDAKLEYVEGPYGGKHTVTYAKASLTPKADAKEWPRQSLYGGLIAENFTQGTAGCLLRYALRGLEIIGAMTVLHVHDEIVLEADIKNAEYWTEGLRAIMYTPPEWCRGIPLKAVPEIMMRYGKPD